MFLIPGLAGVMLFYLLPFLEVVRRSFLKAGNKAFVGIANYRAVLNNNAFRLAARNTVFYLAAGVPLLMGSSLALALLLRKHVARRKFVSAMLLPMAVPAAVMVLTFKILIDRQGFLVVLCSFLWKNTGYMVILWLAGLAALPKDVEEVAKVDGANRWQSLRYIIMPELSGTFFTVGMLSVLQIFKSYREVWMLAGSYPQENIYFLQHLLQNWYLKLEFDKMAALTVILSLVLLGGCLLLQKRLEPER